ncbi:hypothetical protein SLEP1_g60247, partial [Rubroshorea leprosula]
IPSPCAPQRPEPVPCALCTSTPAQRPCSASSPEPGLLPTPALHRALPPITELAIITPSHACNLPCT